jgi:hypothetical protein
MFALFDLNYPTFFNILPKLSWHFKKHHKIKVIIIVLLVTEENNLNNYLVQNIAALL